MTTAKAIGFFVGRYLDNRLIILEIITIGRCVINGTSATHAILAIFKISLLVPLHVLLLFPIHFPRFRLTYLSFFPSRAPEYLFLPRPPSGILFGICPSLLPAEIIEVFSTSEQWAPSLRPTLFAYNPWIDRTFCANGHRSISQSDAAIKLITCEHKLDK